MLETNLGAGNEPSGGWEYPKRSARSGPKSPASVWRGKRMCASTSGCPKRASFIDPSGVIEPISAQPLCIFGNRYDTTSSRSGAWSK